MAGHLKTKPD